MNIQVYWDGNSGVIEHNSDRLNLTSKPNISSVNFDVLNFSEDDNIGIKVYQNKSMELTSEEITTIKAFAKTNAKPVNTLDSAIGQHNVDPDAHHDIRVKIEELSAAIAQLSALYSQAMAMSAMEGSNEC